MSLLSIFSCSKKVSSYPQDKYTAKDGTEITFTFYAHASIAINALGRQIYVDPVGESINWAGEPEADIVLVTHDHFDHLDTAAIRILNGTGDYVRMKPGDVSTPFDGIEIEAVPAYNISEGQLDFHPQVRGDAGYILNIGGSRIYVSGDTEDNDDVLALKDIDVAFICVNQPYTMKVEQCVRVVKALKPAVFYPYHFGGSPGYCTDLEALGSAVEGMTEIRIKDLE